jgi:hypothetical protein
MSEVVSRKVRKKKYRKRSKIIKFGNEIGINCL